MKVSYRLYQLFVIVFVSVLVASLVFALPAFALQDGIEPQPVPVSYMIELIFGLAIAVPGFSLFGAVLLNIGKIFNLVKDDKAGIYSKVLGVVFALFIGYASLYTNWNIPLLDEKFSALSNILITLLPAFVLLYKWLAPLFHNAIKGLWLIGYSHSLQPVQKKQK